MSIKPIKTFSFVSRITLKKIKLKMDYFYEKKKKKNSNK